MALSDVSSISPGNTSNFSQFIDLQERDVYTQEKLKKIQTKRFKVNFDFYVCLVEEGTSKYVLEGSRFTEAFIRNCQKNVSTFNPLTRGIVNSFKIFKYNKQIGESEPKLEFIQIINKSTIDSPPDFMPILWNDHTRTAEERGKFYSRLADYYYKDKKDVKLAIFYYERAALLGYRNAQYNLSIALDRELQAKNQQFQDPLHWKIKLYWMVKYWKDETAISVKGLNELSFAFEDCRLFEKAFLFYEQAAYQGNPYAIGKVIYYYEQGFGVEKDLEKAALWRKSLPISWQNQPIIACMEYFSDPSHSFQSESENLPILRQNQPIMACMEYFSDPSNYSGILIE
jgi:hypothetical protein